MGHVPCLSLHRPWFQLPCLCRAHWEASLSSSVAFFSALFCLLPKHLRSLRCTCGQGCVETGLSSRKQLLHPSWVLFREYQVPTLDELIIYCCTYSPPDTGGRGRGGLHGCIGAHTWWCRFSGGAAGSLSSALPRSIFECECKDSQTVAPLVPRGFSQCPVPK